MYMVHDTVNSEECRSNVVINSEVKRERKGGSARRMTNGISIRIYGYKLPMSFFLKKLVPSLHFVVFIHPCLSLLTFLFTVQFHILHA